MAVVEAELKARSRALQGADSAACVGGVVDRGEVFLVAAAGVLDVCEFGVAAASAGGDHIAGALGKIDRGGRSQEVPLSVP